jgi:hypothetical protein
MVTAVSTIAERSLRRLGVAIVPEAERPALTTIIPASTIATNALVELGVIAAEETPAPADQALALAKVNAAHDSLVAQSFARWTVSAIPQAVAEEYAKLAASAMASSFGKQSELQIYTALEQRVRKVAMLMQADDEATRAVLAVHRDLVARDVARWTVFDLPDYAAQPYEMLAANLLAPSFGMQANPQETLAAMALLAKYVALSPSGERVRAEYF